MDNHTSSIPLKQCSRKENCAHPDGPWLPATNEYFSKDAHSKSGLYASCKACNREDNKKSRERRQRYYYNNQERILQNRAEYRQKNHERIREYDAHYRKTNRNRLLIAKRQRYKANRPQILADAKRYREAHRDQRRQFMKSWRAVNREHAVAYDKAYKKANLSQIRIRNQQRHARKKNLPDLLTFSDWRAALDYFNGCCAVCGRQLNDLFGEHTAAADHWIPLSSPDCPGTVRTNIVPLCHGVNGCNNSKGAKFPDEWLKQRFGARKAVTILARIEAYFEWCKSEESEKGEPHE